jgi:hypothetical protein
MPNLNSSEHSGRSTTERKRHAGTHEMFRLRRLTQVPEQLLPHVAQLPQQKRQSHLDQLPAQSKSIPRQETRRPQKRRPQLEQSRVPQPACPRSIPSHRKSHNVGLHAKSDDRHTVARASGSRAHQQRKPRHTSEKTPLQTYRTQLSDVLSATSTTRSKDVPRSTTTLQIRIQDSIQAALPQVPHRRRTNQRRLCNTIRPSRHRRLLQHGMATIPPGDREKVPSLSPRIRQLRRKTIRKYQHRRT